MNNYARIIIESDTIYMRFERIGNRQKFNALLDQFNSKFIIKDWDERRRAWKLSLNELELLLTFFQTRFGSKGYSIERSIPQFELLVK